MAKKKSDRFIRAESPDADLLQWVFRLDSISKEFDKRVNTQYLCEALRDLTAVSSKPNGSPSEVRLAWQMPYDAAGLFLMGRFIATGA